MLIYVKKDNWFVVFLKGKEETIHIYTNQYDEEVKYILEWIYDGYECSTIIQNPERVFGYSPMNESKESILRKYILKVLQETRISNESEKLEESGKILFLEKILLD